jgi:tRNA threonylcarbamoyladenosine biosynthesis protein TsaE
MYKKTSYSLEDTKKFAEFVLDQVLKERKEKMNSEESLLALVLVLKGDLGSGKTAFTKFIGELLGVSEEVTSPTFSIEKRYKTSIENREKFGIETLIHIDAFRLESGNEILAIDFEETLKDPKNLICFEWPEMVSDIGILPQDAPIIEFEFVDENTRNMFFSPSINTVELIDRDSTTEVEE